MECLSYLRRLQVLQIGIEMLHVHFGVLEFRKFLYLEVLLHVERKVLHEWVTFQEVLLERQLVHEQRRSLLQGEALVGILAKFGVLPLHILQLTSLRLTLA